MMSRKNLVAITGLPAILGLLYTEEWIAYWLHPPGFGAIFILTALVGGWLWAINLPHPRQERKHREALPKEVKEAALAVPFPFPTRPWPEDDKKTLAEKRP